MPTENPSNDADGWIACDDGLHLIQMDKNFSHYGWVFRKVDGGLPYSVREATSHEMAHAQARQHLRIGVAQIAGQAPAPQPHPEPIAWMVGTAIWWTKEEAERDAAATGLPVVPVGPLTGAVEQYPGEPVALPACKAKLSAGHDWDQGYTDGWRACLDEIAKIGPLYTHADPGEVGRLKKELLVARAQGRAEVVEMITELDAETGLDDFIGSHAIADTGDYGSHWNEDDLRQHFNVDPAAASELEMCRYSAHQIIQLERKEEQLRTLITTQKSWMDRFVEYLTESGVPEDLMAEYKAITAARI
ncbi:hypothetical protein HU750_08545 [Pseudomonas sp. SWRI50]|uniref:hypothetical protein n=1 Tax=Pseudomonas sp. SWRI50 TaxID=2745484 RepID=UPI001646CEF7|nr:hypothetical protein [Pseudomonas sp. SWRI50]MBC3485719.1 hypothetical protein [Pseudomonas sp. SWRI50]